MQHLSWKKKWKKQSKYCAVLYLYWLTSRIHLEACSWLLRIDLRWTSIRLIAANPIREQGPEFPISGVESWPTCRSYCKTIVYLYSDRQGSRFMHEVGQDSYICDTDWRKNYLLDPVPLTFLTRIIYYTISWSRK